MTGSDEEIEKSARNIYGTGTLQADEIRLITEAHMHRLNDFAGSARLFAVDAKGETPLHIAARLGNLDLCDLFIRSGINPAARNLRRQTSADVAEAEGHLLLAGLLGLLTHVVTRSNQAIDTFTTRERVDDDRPWTSNQVPQVPPMTPSQPDDTGAYDALLQFEAEEDPDEFFKRSAREAASGELILVGSNGSIHAVVEEADWELDLTPAAITGDGIDMVPSAMRPNGQEHEFLRSLDHLAKSTERGAMPSTQILPPRGAHGLPEHARLFPRDVNRLELICESHSDRGDVARSWGKSQAKAPI